MAKTNYIFFPKPFSESYQFCSIFSILFVPLSTYLSILPFSYVDYFHYKGGTDDASCEKENKDTNGTTATTTTAVGTKTVVDLKGKGKGKGKGKSSQVVKSSQIDVEMTEEQIMEVKVRI